jgi:hypothetical protein
VLPSRNGMRAESPQPASGQISLVHASVQLTHLNRNQGGEL